MPTNVAFLSLFVGLVVLLMFSIFTAGGPVGGFFLGATEEGKTRAISLLLLSVVNAVLIYFAFTSSAGAGLSSALAISFFIITATLYIMGSSRGVAFFVGFILVYWEYLAWIRHRYSGELKWIGEYIILLTLPVVGILWALIFYRYILEEDIFDMLTRVAREYSAYFRKKVREKGLLPVRFATRFLFLPLCRMILSGTSPWKHSSEKVK